MEMMGFAGSAHPTYFCCSRGQGLYTRKQPGRIIGADARNALSSDSRRDARDDRTGRFPRAGMARRLRGGQAWIAQLRASGPPPSPNLGVVIGLDFAQLSANLGRNLMEGRIGILTAVFEAA
jgi:hypothetical protein